MTTATAQPFGPWATGISEPERSARVRELRALTMLICGERHPLTVALRAAENGDDTAAERALIELDKLEPLRRRRVLSVYASLRTPTPSPPPKEHP